MEMENSPMSKPYVSCHEIARKAGVAESTVYTRAAELLQLNLAIRNETGWGFHRDAVKYILEKSYAPVLPVVKFTIEHIGVSSLDETEVLKIARVARHHARSIGGVTG